MQWLLMMSLMISLLYGAPAFNSEQRFDQPDGTTFKGKQRGDEYLHWIESDSGDIILFNKKSRRFEHAELVGDTLQANGDLFVHTEKKSSASGLHRRSDSEALKRVWMGKRYKAIKRKSDASHR